MVVQRNSPLPLAFHNAASCNCQSAPVLLGFCKPTRFHSVKCFTPLPNAQRYCRPLQQPHNIAPGHQSARGGHVEAGAGGGRVVRGAGRAAWGGGYALPPRTWAAGLPAYLRHSALPRTVSDSLLEGRLDPL
jgi:hypothetical protein